MKFIFANCVCVCIIAALVLAQSSFAQNKSLGVGLANPNPNAVLHVESPGANQGFIMPRLSTAQRTAAGFQGVLGANEAGLMVYDTDLKGIYIWDGGKWGSAAKLVLPYVDTVSTAPSGSNLFRLVYNGAAAGNVGVAHFENMNPNSGFSAIFGRTNSLTNGVADFVVNNAANNNDAIGVSTNGVGTAVRASTSGTGPAVVIANSNAANTSPALEINQAGSGNALLTNGRIQASQFVGDGSLLTGVGFSLPRKDSIVNATGTTDLFALKYNNAENKRVLRVENLNRNNGSSAVSIGNNGSGLGLYVQNLNDTTSSSAIYATINSNKMSAIPNPVAVYGEATGTAATGASFRVTNAGNDRPALYAETLGTGATIVSQQNGANGHAAYFEVVKAGNGGSGLYARTNGTGSALSALSTGSGPSLSLDHNNNGHALSINSGGTVLSVIDVTTLPATIDTKAAIYNITTTGNLTLGTAGRVNGETVIVTVDEGILGVIVEAGNSFEVPIGPRESLTFVFVGGYWRALGLAQP